MSDKNLIWIILAIIIVGGIVFYPTIKEKVSGAENFLEVKYYDSQGNEIKKDGTMAIVGTTEGVASIGFDINVKNTGDKPLTLTITSLTPTSFDSVITKTAKTANVGETIKWTSNLINVEQFVSQTQPTRFSANVKGTYMVGTVTREIVKTGYLDLTIKQDPTGNFDINIGSPTIASIYCEADSDCQLC